MEEWRFVDLGPRDGFFIQSVYEAVAKRVGAGRSPPTVLFVYPSHPYVCIGVHQLPDLEVDIGFCRSKGIPVVRRQVGGGAVYLDQNQQFYHVVVPKDHPVARGPVKSFFERVLRAVVEFYRSYGLPAEYKPVNDVVVRGRKASGNGAALLHEAMVLVGNVILDFDADTAARVLRVPDEKLRSHLVSSMREWVTSLRRELGYVPPRGEVVRRLRESFERALGVKLVEGELSPEELEETGRIASAMRSPEWLYALAHGREYLVHRYAPGTRLVKIREGHYVVYAEHRGAKTVRLTLEVVGEEVRSAILSGDFFVVPPEAVEAFGRRLEGLSVEELRRRAEALAREWFSSDVSTAAGLAPEDVVAAVGKALEILRAP